jgi:tRNA(fMet)-specific endonuclease VapC
MFLIDSDILIYFLKGHAKVVRNFEEHSLSPKAMSIISYGELQYGAYKSKKVVENLARVKKLNSLLPIHDIEENVMDIFAYQKAELSKNGVSVDDFDLLIGATAMSLNYVLVTNNTRHFKKITGLEIVNWTL